MAKRRARGEGTINKRSGGRWEGRLTLPDGRRRSFYGATQDAVVKQMNSARAKPEEQQTPARLTVQTYLTGWLAEQKLTATESTYRRYEQHVRLHLIPELGRHNLTSLTRSQILAAYARRKAAGLSGTSIYLMQGVLHKALNDAMADPSIGLTRNPASRMGTKRSKPRMRTLIEEEVRQLLRVAHGEKLEAMIVLGLTCGLRIGEVLALRWRDVDLDGKRLRVVATLSSRKGGVPVLGEPKTAGSKREVLLSELATAALSRRLAIQAKEREAAGATWVEHGLVFTTGFGAPIDANNFSQRTLRPLLEQAGLPPMRFHDLRHTAATSLMGAGVPVKVASEMLGHADVGITLRLYSHVMPAMQTQAAAAMDRLFGAAS